MILKQILIIIALLTFGTSCSAKIEDKHRSCQTDSDCVLIGQGGCCGQDLAINQKFAKQFAKPAKEECHSMLVECLKVKAVCQKKVCTRVKTDRLK